MLSKYQLMISNLHNVPIGNVKKLASNVFDKEKYMLDHENLQLEVRIETKKIHHVLELIKSQWLKSYVDYNAQERIETETKLTNEKRKKTKKTTNKKEKKYVKVKLH